MQQLDTPVAEDARINSEVVFSEGPVVWRGSLGGRRRSGGHGSLALVELDDQVMHVVFDGHKDAAGSECRIRVTIMR
jgi:hypothetical protein